MPGRTPDCLRLGVPLTGFRFTNLSGHGTIRSPLLTILEALVRIVKHLVQTLLYHVFGNSLRYFTFVRPSKRAYLHCLITPWTRCFLLGKAAAQILCLRHVTGI